MAQTNLDRPTLCARYEMTQREFRSRRGEQWCPRFIKKFGDLATKLYKDLYGRPPHKTEPSRKIDQLRDLREPVGLYPLGILQEAYRRLIAAGEPLGEPYRHDPTIKREWKEPGTRTSKRLAAYGGKLANESIERMIAAGVKVLEDGPHPEEVRQRFLYGRIKEIAIKKIKEKVAKRAADIAEVSQQTYGRPWDLLNADEQLAVRKQIDKSEPTHRYDEDEDDDRHLRNDRASDKWLWGR